jgi:hypothetical protein
LTGRQRSALFSLPQHEADLLRHYTLSDEDLQHIEARRRSRNKLGFALQLCVLRYPGRLLAPGEFIPPAVVDFIGRQLDLDGYDSSTFTNCVGWYSPGGTRDTRVCAGSVLVGAVASNRLQSYIRPLGGDVSLRATMEVAHRGPHVVSASGAGAAIGLVRCRSVRGAMSFTHSAVAAVAQSRGEGDVPSPDGPHDPSQLVGYRERGLVVAAAVANLQRPLVQTGQRLAGPSTTSCGHQHRARTVGQPTTISVTNH